MIYSFIKGFKLDDNVQFTDSYIFSQNNKNYIISKETGGSIILDDKLINEIVDKQISNDLWLKLIQRGVAIHSENKLCINSKNNFQFYLIDITQKCNLDCVYCFRDHSKSNTISDNTLDLILKKINDYCKLNGINRVTIQAWGGEPLLALDKIMRIHDKSNDDGIIYDIDIETNGTLLSKDTVNLLKNMGIHIGVSIDGDEINHNIQRPYINSIDSYNDVVSGIKNMQEIYGKTKFGTICVITKNSVNNFNKILNTFVYDLGLVNLKFNIVRDNEFASKSSLSLSKDEVREFAKNLYLEIIHICNSGKLIYEATLMDRLNNLIGIHRDNCCNSKGCLGGRKIISFDTNGDIYPCEVVDFKDECVGNILDIRQLDEIFSASYETKPYFMKKYDEACNDCPWVSFCKGGCTSRMKYIGKYGNIDIVECELNQTLYPLLVELILENPNIVNKLIEYTEGGI